MLLMKMIIDLSLQVLTIVCRAAGEFRKTYQKKTESEILDSIRNLKNDHAIAEVGVINEYFECFVHIIMSLYVK